MKADESWYRSLFEEAADQLREEASACYTRWPHFGDVASRMASLIPEARLIFIMHHPVDRAYSHFSHLMQERLALHGETFVEMQAALDDFSEISGYQSVRRPGRSVSRTLSSGSVTLVDV